MDEEYDETEAEGISVSEVDKLSECSAAVADIWAILYHDGPDTEWSVGMLEDIAAIVQSTGVTHPNPPTYYRH